MCIASVIEDLSVLTIKISITIKNHNFIIFKEIGANF
jgi:hypothetical protein